MKTKINSFKTIYQGGIGEISVKKSRFIATVSPVETEEEAIAFIESLKKKYWDASHNCSAYIIGCDKSILRCSDDGEPSKTAGKPMLDILQGLNLTNLVVVVTRYFGGTLLGTGGLVKAYQDATKIGLDNCILVTKQLGTQLSLTSDYNYIGKILYAINQDQYTIISSNYTDIVEIEVILPISNKNAFVKKLIELTNATILIDEKEQVYYTIVDNEVHLYP